MSFLEFRYSVPTDWPYWLSPKSALDTYLKLIAYQGVLESLLIWTSGPCFMWEVKLKRHKTKQNPQNQNLLLMKILMKIKRGWSAWMVMLTCSWFLWKDPLGFSWAALQQTGVSETKKWGSSRQRGAAQRQVSEGSSNRARELVGVPKVAQPGSSEGTGMCSATGKEARKEALLNVPASRIHGVVSGYIMEAT